MEKYQKTIGNMGEDAAEKYLKKKGYSIIKRNFTIRGGEIDIIAGLGDYVVFVEVKTRRDNTMGSGLEAVTYLKQQSVRKTAQYYLGINADVNVRFDVIEIVGELVNDKLKVKDIIHIENAF